MIDLAKYCYHFVKPPSDEKPASPGVTEARPITTSPQRHPETGKMWCPKCGNHGRQNESYICENCQDWEWDAVEEDT